MDEEIIIPDDNHSHQYIKETNGLELRRMVDFINKKQGKCAATDEVKLPAVCRI